MKYKLLYIISFIFLFSEMPVAHAAFRIKKQFPANIIMPVSNSEHAASKTKSSKISHVFKVIRSALNPDMHGMAGAGFVGILALLFGVLGFLHPVFAMLAIIFGLIGIGRWKRNSGMAVAGLILGIALLALTAFFGFTPFLAM